MSRFELQSQTIEVRGENVVVRELSQGQKCEWVKCVGEDHRSAAHVLVSYVIEPPVTVEEAAGWPAQVIEQIARVALRLSGMEKDEGKEKND